MWQNFYTSSNNLLTTLASMDRIKKDIYDMESIKLKEYFAKKVVLAFDNLMIFFASNGLDMNLKQALAESQEEMNSAKPLFPEIKMYLLKEDVGYSLMISNLEASDVAIGMLEVSGFDYVGQEDGIIENLPKLEFNSWSTLAFHFSLVNYSHSWINYTPILEERAIQQAEHILFRMTFKKTDSNLHEKLLFLENIKKHPNYKELYEKIVRLMPKLETSLEKQWRVSVVDSEKLKIK